MDYKKKILLLLPLVLILAGINLMPYFIRGLSKQANIDPDNVTEEYDSSAKEGIFNNKIVEVPKTTPIIEPVLGESTDSDWSEKRIEVNLTKQMAYAYEGYKLIYSFLISSGTWGRTPNGTFKIWTKVRSQKMSGGSKELGTYYYLPNVQNVMFFYNDNYEKKLGFSFHQAYWHNNFGVPMSHGCINMTTADSATLYNWANVGTKVFIYGKYQTVLPKI
jgi:hypothetical protein